MKISLRDPTVDTAISKTASTRRLSDSLELVTVCIHRCQLERPIHLPSGAQVTHHRKQVDRSVGFIERDEQCWLMSIFTLLRCFILLGHVQLDVAKVRLEEPCKSLDTQSLCALRLRVCMRMGMFGGVRMLVWMGRD